MLYAPARAAISGLPDGTAGWAEWNAQWYQQFDHSFSGCEYSSARSVQPWTHVLFAAAAVVITGDGPHMDSPTEALYAGFSPNGIVDQGFAGQRGPHLTHGGWWYQASKRFRACLSVHAHSCTFAGVPVFLQSDISSNATVAAGEIVGYWDRSNSAPQFTMFR